MNAAIQLSIKVTSYVHSLSIAFMMMHPPTVNYKCIIIYDFVTCFYSVGIISIFLKPDHSL